MLPGAVLLNKFTILPASLSQVHIAQSEHTFLWISLTLHCFNV